MSEPITITLPIPPEELTGNGLKRRIHRGKRTRIETEYKDSCRWAARAALQKTTWTPPSRASVRIVWYLGYRARALDGDNALIGLKHGFDSMTREGVWTDDRGNRYEPIEWRRDAKHPRVEVEVRGNE